MAYPEPECHVDQSEQLEDDDQDGERSDAEGQKDLDEGSQEPDVSPQFTPPEAAEEEGEPGSLSTV